MADAAEQVAYVVDPSGKLGTVPKSQLFDALQAGYSPAQDPNDTLANQAAAGAEGVAKGLIPGAPTLESKVLPKAGSLEAQKSRAAMFPATHGVGQLAGGVAQMAGLAALTGGLAPAAEGASLVGEGLEGASTLAEGAAALPEAGSALALPEAAGTELALPADQATQALAEGVQPIDALTQAGTTPGALSTTADAAVAQAAPRSVLASGYTQQAVAGAGSNATNYVNESELGDHQFNGEALAMEVGLGALMGAAGEGAVNVLKNTVAPPLIRKAGEAIEATKSKLADLFYAASDKVNSLEEGTTRAAGEAIASGAGKFSDTKIDSLAKDLSQVKDQVEDVSGNHFAKIGPDEAESALRDVAPEQVRQPLQAVREELGNRLSAIGDRIDQLRSDNAPVGIVNRSLGTVKSAFRDFDKVLADKTASAFDMHQATVDLRRTVDTAMAWNKTFEPGAERDLMQEMRESIRAPLKNALNHAGIFGPEAAGRNAAINDAFSGMYNAQKNLMSDLGQKEIGETGQKEFSISPGKLRTVLNGDPLAAQMKVKHLADYLDAAKNYLGEMQQSAANAGVQVPGGDDLDALLQSVTKQRQDAQAFQPIARLLKDVRTQAPWGLGAGGAAPLAGVAAHGLGAAAPVIAPIVAGVAALRAPVKAMQMFAKVSGTAAAAKDLISSGVSKVLANAPARTALVGSATAAGMRGFLGSGSFEKQAKTITDLATNQQAQTQALTENTARLGSVAPQTTQSVTGTATRAVQALYAALPKDPAPSLILSENKDWKPNDTQLFTWNNIHSAILKPQSFLAKMADGTATPEAWAALQQVYPTWTGQVQSAILDHLASHPKLDLDVGQKAAISMVLGKAVSPTIAPDQVAFQQAMFAQSPQQGPPPPGGRHRKPTQHGMDKLSLGERSSPGHHTSD